MNLDRARTTPRDTRSQADMPTADFLLLPQPSTDAYPGGGVILQYRDGSNRVLDHTYRPYDPAAMMQRWGPHLVSQLYSGVDIGPTGFFDVLANVQRYQVSWRPPLPSDATLYRIFPFIASLNIRIWDPKVAQVPGRSTRFFGLDFVSLEGDPQHVGADVEVVVGRRSVPGGPEVEGQALVPIDDVDLTSPQTFGVFADVVYEFHSHNYHIISYSFPYNLLE
ncbi:hypothetical protein ARMGADRAFT_1085790 [Armillaria gallica]|uniref:Uncharacterized protein n=1 Tax=Armillaria gallica TaxID=47427 RepID=A0A2H3CWG9_ARMGA|nr:hypothetical protein ARMGADRAFT_1085773 [Armillaria gallica]PBK87393.1 hypothetical protein ARMGADRAFT_1085790 [Armillaria gallica]